MRVQLTTDRASMLGYHPAGDILTLPNDEARRLIQSGDAIPVRSTPVEKTVRSTPRRRTTKAA